MVKRYIPQGDYRGLNMIGAGGTYPPRWWKPLRTAFAWLGFAAVVRVVWDWVF